MVYLRDIRHPLLQTLSADSHTNHRRKYYAQQLLRQLPALSLCSNYKLYTRSSVKMKTTSLTFTVAMLAIGAIALPNKGNLSAV